MDYNTGVKYTGAMPEADRQLAIAGLQSPSPYKYPGAHQDMYAALAHGNATDFSRAAQAADIAMMTQSRNAQAQTALNGLNQMAQAQNNARSVANQMYGNQMGFVGNLLNGLFT